MLAIISFHGHLQEIYVPLWVVLSVVSNSETLALPQTRFICIWQCYPVLLRVSVHALVQSKLYKWEIILGCCGEKFSNFCVTIPNPMCEKIWIVLYWLYCIVLYFIVPFPCEAYLKTWYPSQWHICSESSTCLYVITPCPRRFSSPTTPSEQSTFFID